RVTTIPAPGPHGGDGPRVAAALGLGPHQVLDLSANLNPFAPDVAALAAPHVGSLRRDPDVQAAGALLAEGGGAPGERLVLTAGGSPAIALVGDHLRRGWVDEPDFSLYRRHLARVEAGGPPWRSGPHKPPRPPAPGGGRAVGAGLFAQGLRLPRAAPGVRRRPRRAGGRSHPPAPPGVGGRLARLRGASGAAGVRRPGRVDRANR